MTDLSRQAQEQIMLITRERSPEEAVGAILRRPGEPEIVVALTNISDEPQSSYALRVDELIEKVDLQDVAESDIIIWHSHPSGSVGPSRKDMQSKLSGVRYMVVSLVRGEPPVFTEF